MAIYFLHELVYSDEDGIMGLCVLVFECSGELVDRTEETECGVPCRSGTRYVVGRSTSVEESAGAPTGAPMEIPSSL